MREISGELVGAPDFETGRPRPQALTYRASLPDREPALGLVFVIPGFGGDSIPDYADTLRRHIAAAHGYVAVSVRYHCFEARTVTGARFDVDQRELMFLAGVCALGGVSLPAAPTLLELAQGAARAAPGCSIHGALIPGRGEHQNFGVLQALDHLNALYDLVARGVRFDARRIVAFGSSHGGYIAHLAAKIAPQTFALVLDNSAYVRPPMNYLGAAPESVLELAGVQVGCSVKPGWTFDDRDAPTFYDRNADVMRDLGFPPHLAAQRAQSGEGACAFRMWNAAADVISKPHAKRAQAEALRRAGFDADLKIVGAGDIDGRIFKANVHGLEASLKGLFDQVASSIPVREDASLSPAGACVRYACVDDAYAFEVQSAAPYVIGRREPLFGVEAVETAARSAA